MIFPKSIVQKTILSKFLDILIIELLQKIILSKTIVV